MRRGRDFVPVPVFRQKTVGGTLVPPVANGFMPASRGLREALTRARATPLRPLPASGALGLAAQRLPTPVLILLSQITGPALATQQQAAPLLPEPSPRCPVGTSHR